MAHQVIKYRLNTDGTIPDCVYFGEGETHGYYGVYNIVDEEVVIAPYSLLQVGISCDGAIGDFEVISSPQELETYLEYIQTLPDGSVMPLFNPEENPDLGIPFDPKRSSAWMWSRLDALNAAV